MSAEKPGNFDVSFVVDAQTISAVQEVFRYVEQMKRDTIEAEISRNDAKFRNDEEVWGPKNQPDTFEARVARRIDQHRKESHERLLGINISVSCSDGITRNFPSFEELLKYPNDKNKEIISLEISNKFDRENYCSVEFSSRKYGDSIAYKIRGKEDVVITVSSKMDDIIDSVAQWYSKWRISPSAVGMVWVGWWVGWSIMEDQLGFPAISIGSYFSYDKLLAFLFKIAVIGSPFVVGLIWHFLLKLFPKGIFALNEGAKRYDRLRFWRTTVILLALIVPLGREGVIYLISKNVSP